MDSYPVFYSEEFGLYRRVTYVFNMYNRYIVLVAERVNEVEGNFRKTLKLIMGAKQ